ncbi:MAG: hypothetical protein GHCLOJNM_00999 [bacterium]|nr:hypothetical protein [bacterium]
MAAKYLIPGILCLSFALGEEARAQAPEREELPMVVPLRDPIEPVNRTLGFVNHGIMIGVIDPTSRLYRLIIPRPVRKCVNNFSTNLTYPGRLVNNALQWQWDGAWTETQRFGVNTTVGVLGLFDPATDWDIGKSEEDTGLTFGEWGWNNQMFLMLPFFGPRSERDSIGLVGDTLMNPATYLFPASFILTYNRLTDDIIPYKQLTSSEYDPYAISRDLWSLTRWGEIEAPMPPRVDEGAVETLGAIDFGLDDPNFYMRQKKRKVLIPATGEKLPYSFWLRRDPARVVYILPGLGAHRQDVFSVAMAEKLYNSGFSVVTLSSPMNWEFMFKGSAAAVPGYAPIDVPQILKALDLIHEDLTARYPGRVTGRSLLGISLGAFHTLVIASVEERDGNRGPRFERYAAINPPVDLIHGMRQLDSYYNAPLAWPASEREERINLALRKGVVLAKTERGEEAPVRFTSQEAQYLIGLRYRLNLRDIIHAGERRSNLGVIRSGMGLMNRRAAYEEISAYSFTDYFERFVVPYLNSLGKGDFDMRRIRRASDLKSRGDSLASNPRVRVLTNRNDFLLTQADVSWLEDTFPEERLEVLPHGGHLGNLSSAEVQNWIPRALQ